MQFSFLTIRVLKHRDAIFIEEFFDELSHFWVTRYCWMDNPRRKCDFWIAS